MTIKSTFKKSQAHKASAMVGVHIASKLPSVVNEYNANANYAQISDEIQQFAEKRINCNTNSTAGYVAEIHHQRTFEADAVRKGYQNISVKRGPQGGSGSKGSADLVISDHGNVVGKGGLKYLKTAKDTASHQSKPDYQGQQKVCPSDQIDSIHKISCKKAQKLNGRADQYADTHQNATDRLKYKDIESKPLSKSQATEIVKDSSSYSRDAMYNDLKTGAKSGAVGGLISSSVFSTVKNTKDYIQGEKPLTDAMKEIAKDTAIGGIKGATIGVGSQAVKHVLIKQGMNNLAKGSVPTMIASSALEAGIDISKEVKKWSNGEQDFGDLAIRSVGHTVAAGTKGGTAFAAAEIGASIGVVGGPVGMAIGGAIGGTLGYFAGDLIVNYFKK